jgi:hypothetical protein
LTRTKNHDFLRVVKFAVAKRIPARRHKNEIYHRHKRF